jgi:flagellar basal body-associated protein FliL
MSRLRLLIPAAVAVLALCVGTGAASATTTTKSLSPTADCTQNQGKLTQSYTAKELQNALTSMSSSTKEYTTCFNAISDALSADLGQKPISDTSGSGSGGGSGTLILVIVIIVVILGGGGAATWAYRRNRDGGDPPSGDEPPTGVGPIT